MIHIIKRKLKSIPFLKKYIYPIIFKISVLLKYRRIIIKKYGFNAMKLVDEVASKNNIPYLVYFGTLLGIIREGNFIKYDTDIDFMILPTDKSIAKFLQNLINEGFEFEQAFLIDDERFDEFRVRYKEISIDFFLPNISASNLILIKHSLMFDIPETKRFSIKNFSINIPSNPENHLSWYYGEDWKIPNKIWNSKNSKAYIGEKICKVDIVSNLDIFMSMIDKLNQTK